MTDGFPERIVCLTEEPTEVLYALGEEDRIVGISRFTVRPAHARREKPRVSGFTSAHIDEICALDPHLVVGFSDIQADIARELVARGIEVWISNHRTVAGILSYVRRLGAMVGAAERAELYAASLAHHVDRVRGLGERLDRRPVVYFEEWHEPLITAIGWVAELIRVAGGVDAFPERSASSLARGRIIADPSEVIAASPDLILASWCGKRVQTDAIVSRPGWDAIPAVAHRDVYEIDSAIILQPGPAALTDGLEAIHDTIAAWATEK